MNWRRNNGRGGVHFTRPKKTPQEDLPPLSPNMVRFVAVSDTHSRAVKAEVPDGDVLLHAGDFTGRGTLSEAMQFNMWLGTLPHKHKVVIAGNHDVLLDAEECGRARALPADPTRFLTNAIYLCDDSVTLFGIKIYGTPWIPEYHSPMKTASDKWKEEKYPHLRAFEIPRGAPLRQKWQAIPEDTDILLTHTPPLGQGDLTARKKRAGCEDLLEAVQRRVKPKYHVFGHIHEGYGVSKDAHTVYMNASVCNSRYQAVNIPLVFDLPLPDGVSKA
ncbi:Metallophosphoesterase domain-containing protein 1 [Penaeus vannamei]|uniref:Metallophosphoesterase domain-containing protein 1 n=1 Tax=Penaeus vannamei TaxID=6689 RepID=A0A3R7PFL7_PENVA|nr:metallophosphoesterase domain-containing protein 1-like [Penaeus vannamei]XP_027221521.1 metallophosphoesterase domain-containing protein 1-like [Penaeus vannamei]XP_027221523.1 metallophosphoesterase domain-containing protein 1-like [Penaeus vannamei]XP_027221524.1 metallophosphoesterase domain-containing protein 1-like [Penaeus vannamei]ROT85583.1 Metallophosphoesterase domain-containing protein 1 [Penaeus vannamei]